MTHYTRYTVGRQGDKLADDSNINNIYSADTAAVTVAAEETLSIILDVTNLGYIYDNTDVVMQAEGTITNTPDIVMANAIGGTAIATDAMVDVGATYTWNGPEDDGDPDWTFDNLREREFQVVCGTGESVDVSYICFHLQFALFDKNVRRVRFAKTKSHTKILLVPIC